MTRRQKSGIEHHVIEALDDLHVVVVELRHHRHERVEQAAFRRHEVRVAVLLTAL